MVAVVEAGKLRSRLATESWIGRRATGLDDCRCAAARPIRAAHFERTKISRENFPNARARSVGSERSRRDLPATATAVVARPPAAIGCAPALYSLSRLVARAALVAGTSPRALPVAEPTVSERRARPSPRAARACSCRPGSPPPDPFGHEWQLPSEAVLWPLLPALSLPAVGNERRGGGSFPCSVQTSNQIHRSILLLEMSEAHEKDKLAEEEQEEEEEHILLELDDCLYSDIPPNAPYVLSGLDTLTPTLIVGDGLEMIGEYEETVGTYYLFLESDAPPKPIHNEILPSGENKDKQAISSKEAPSKEVKHLASVHKILKFRSINMGHQQHRAYQHKDREI